MKALDFKSYLKSFFSVGQEKDKLRNILCIVLSSLSKQIYFVVNGIANNANVL